jgi:hypothetical protein
MLTPRNGAHELKVLHVTKPFPTPVQRQLVRTSQALASGFAAASPA